MTLSDLRTRIPALPFMGLITSASLPNLTLGFLKCKTGLSTSCRRLLYFLLFLRYHLFFSLSHTVDSSHRFC